jgi:hypothetical protein
MTSAITDSLNSISTLLQNKTNKSGDTLTGSLAINNQNQIQFEELTTNGTNYVSLQAPANLPTTLNFTLPATIGNTNQVLTNMDGLGTLGWSSGGGGGSYDQSLNTTDHVAFARLTCSSLIATNEAIVPFGSSTISLTTLVSFIDLNMQTEVLILPLGINGQIKILISRLFNGRNPGVTLSNAYVLVPTQITWTDRGQSVILYYSSLLVTWIVLSANGVTIT